MLMPKRSYAAATGYRYGFNGKLNDNDVKGLGNQQDYGMRIYDPRIGKFLSVDPLSYSYPWYTPYQFAGNTPIGAVDLDGLEEYVVTYYKDQNNRTTEIQVRVIFDNDGNLLNQHIHRVGETKDIAKGKVLVFESFRQNNNSENLKIIDQRNIPNSQLTREELRIFNRFRTPIPEREVGETQYLGYGGNSLDENDNQYISNEFENSKTQTFSAETIINRRRITDLNPKIQISNLFILGSADILGGNNPSGNYNGAPLKVSQDYKKYEQLLKDIKEDAEIKSITIQWTIYMPSVFNNTEKSSLLKGIQRIKEKLQFDFGKAGVKNVNILISTTEDRSKSGPATVTMMRK